MKSWARNSGALLLESIARMGAGFVVAILLARQYGPEGLGLITTATSFVVVFLGFSALGLSGVLVRELVEKSSQRGAIMLTVTLAKLVAGLVLLVALVVAVMAYGNSPSLLTLTLIMGFGYLFASLDTVDCLYNARLEFPRLVALRLTALGLSTAVKVAAIQLDWGLEIVALGYAMDFGLLYLLPAADFMLRRKGGTQEDGFTWSVDVGELRILLARSWPVLVSGGFAQINLKIDAIIIAALTSLADVGIYSAASRLSEAWSVLAMAIVTASFPVLVRVARSDVPEYGKKLAALLRKLIWLSVLGAVIISIAAPAVIAIIYGPEFKAAGAVLAIHVFGGIFLFVRTAVSRWLIIEELLKLSLVSHVSGAVVNVALNFALIPVMGIQGAAWASVASYATSGVLFLAFTARSRVMLLMILSAAVPARWSAKSVERLAQRMAVGRNEE